MASSLIRRSLATLAVVNYLLAVTVGGWFHDHGPSVSSGCSGCHPSQCRGHDGHRDGDGNDPAGCGEQPICQVCRFLAQKPIPPAPAEEVLVWPLVFGATPAGAIAAPVAIVSSEDIRAPPSAA